MKKIITFTIFLLVSIALFASSAPVLNIGLDLTQNPITYFGVTTDEVDLSSYTKANDLQTQVAQSISISLDQRDITQTAEASFKVWWYIYSSEKYKVYINFRPLTSGANKIDFTINDGTKDYSSSDTDKYDDTTRVVDLTGETALITGFKEFTIPQFDRFDLIPANYASSFTVRIVTNN